MRTMKKAPQIKFRLQADGTWKSTQGRVLLTIGDDTLTDARAALECNYVIRRRDGRAIVRHSLLSRRSW